jgi:hypothetical protein
VRIKVQIVFMDGYTGSKFSYDVKLYESGTKWDFCKLEKGCCVRPIIKEIGYIYPKRNACLQLNQVLATYTY